MNITLKEKESFDILRVIIPTYEYEYSNIKLLIAI